MYSGIEPNMVQRLLFPESENVEVHGGSCKTVRTRRRGIAKNDAGHALFLTPSFGLPLWAAAERYERRGVERLIPDDYKQGTRVLN